MGLTEHEWIYITSDVPYLKLPNQTASGPLYAGMISCSLEDPDGGGAGSGLWVSGEGTDIMAMGSRVANIPSSENATAIVVQDIVVDELESLNKDFATITVTDDDWNWWKAEISMKETKSIDSIYLRSGNGASQNLTDFSFITYPTVDLFNPDNFELAPEDEHGIGGMYQNASVGSNNRLVTNLADDTLQKDLALVSFRLLVDDD